MSLHLFSCIVQNYGIIQQETSLACICFWQSWPNAMSRYDFKLTAMALMSGLPSYWCWTWCQGWQPVMEARKTKKDFQCQHWIFRLIFKLGCQCAEMPLGTFCLTCACYTYVSWIQALTHELCSDYSPERIMENVFENCTMPHQVIQVWLVWPINICLDIAGCNRPLCRTCESLERMTIAATWPRHDVAICVFDSKRRDPRAAPSIPSQATNQGIMLLASDGSLRIASAYFRTALMLQIEVLLQTHQSFLSLGSGSGRKDDPTMPILKDQCTLEKSWKSVQIHQNPVKSPDDLIPLQKGHRPISLHHQGTGANFHSRTKNPSTNLKDLHRLYIYIL